MIEIIEKSKRNCHTKLGILTGLEPVTTYVKWYPDGDTFQERSGIEGYFILKKIPNSAKPYTLSPLPLPEQCAADLQATYREIKKKWGNLDSHKDIVQEWKKWMQIYCPAATDDVNAYVKQLQQNNIPYHEPLKMILYNKDDRPLSEENWSISIEDRANGNIFILFKFYN